MMAAATIKEMEPTLPVSIFDKNDHLGAKVIISGGGRCNVTTAVALSNNRHDIDRLLENYPRGAKFLMSAMFRTPPQAIVDWFESHGVPLKTEDDLRVFPRSDDGHDIVGALEKTVTGWNTDIHLSTNVTSIEKVASIDPAQPIFRLHTRNGHHDVDILILTTGGNAYRHTGSTGDGYSFAKALGHTITDLAPSLSSYITMEKWPAKVSGVSFEKVSLTMKTSPSAGEKPRSYTRTGPLLFTHKGVTGPAVFALSALAAYEAPTNGNHLHLTINFMPDEKPEEFSERFQELANVHGAKKLINFLDIFLPKSLCNVFIELLADDKNSIDTLTSLQASRIDKDLKSRITKLLTALPLTIINRTPGDEFVTAGGVPTTEIHPNTMESKL